MSIVPDAAQPALRRPGLEVLLVLGVSLGQSAVYSILNIIGIANGSISLDTPEDADFAKVEAEMAAEADKDNKED